LCSDFYVRGRGGSAFKCNVAMVEQNKSV